MEAPSPPSPSASRCFFIALVSLCFLLFFSAHLAVSGAISTSSDLHSAVTQQEQQQQQQQEGRGGNKLWCVANPSAPDDKLLESLNFACAQVGASCMALNPGGPCHNPNTLLSHASYAMNRYYQAQGRNYWNCDFHNTGLVVFTDPSYGNCIYPAQ